MPVVPNCGDCFARDECGGWTLSGEGEPLITCFDAFGNSNGLFIDPKRRKDFWQRLAEVRYFQPPHPAPFHSTSLPEFPDYVTLVQGGVYFRRPLAINHAALNLIEVFHGDRLRGLGFGRRALTAQSLRAEWGLAPDTDLMLSGVAGDPELERLWGNHRAVDLAAQVAALRVTAVTAPNFTFWKNAPRLENIVNRLRMFRVAEAMTDAGVRVIPHFNSTQPRDLQWMFEFFREHGELCSVCMEFRTGNRIKDVRQRKVQELASLRDRLGRELLPVVIGNTDAARELRAYFPRVVAIDSMPALKTVRRQRAISGSGVPLNWRTEPIASGVCMADLFEANFSVHSAHVLSRLALPMETQASSATSAAPRKTLRCASQLLQAELPLEAA